MAKPARIPTGPAAETPARPRRERTVLPPMGGYPIEVTRDGDGENVGQEAGTPAAGVPAPARPEPAAPVVTATAAPGVPSAITEGLPEAIQHSLTRELPASTAAPAEVITACEQRLHAAQTLSEAMEARKLAAYFHYAGPAVRLAHATGHWRQVVDPSTGKPVRSWSAWLRLRKVSRQHAHRMVKEQPITEALAGLNTGTLGVRQIDALSPVLTQHGKPQVRMVWETAAETGDTSAPSLERVRDQLGFRPTDNDGDDGEDEGKPSSAAMVRFQAAPGRFDENLVRTATRAQPEVARMIARTILAELGDDAT